MFSHFEASLAPWNSDETNVYRVAYQDDESFASPRPYDQLAHEFANHPLSDDRLRRQIQDASIIIACRRGSSAACLIYGREELFKSLEQNGRRPSPLAVEFSHDDELEFLAATVEHIRGKIDDDGSVWNHFYEITEGNLGF
ncbi:MAG TPA: hypothetical protein VGN57_07110 [Pirellulaceae bacterium]|jgi:hypothetical protein|nr:hypothetical protein [Pirellulaceae bacterium]